MATAQKTRWAQRFILASVGFLLAWYVAILADAPRRVEVFLALFGFVFHVVFGKAYSLVPSYFARELRLSWAPATQFSLTVSGTGLLALVAAFPDADGAWFVEPLGATLWSLGVLVFLGAVAWTIRDNLAGRDTGTSDAQADRRRVDRAANAFVPLALGYLAVGTYGLLASATPLPLLMDGYAPRVSHLVAAGGAGLLVFALGFRLLPRFLVATPPAALVAFVLPSGAVGPALIALGLPAGPLFHAGAALEATAVVGFAVAYGTMFVRSNRRRVGFYGVFFGVLSGVAAAALGVWFAVEGTVPALALAHLRLNLQGFLGLTIVGLVFQFYPPAIGSFPGAGDRTALASILALAVGLAGQASGLVVGSGLVTAAGEATAFLGALLYAWLVTGLLTEHGA